MSKPATDEQTDRERLHEKFAELGLLKRTNPGGGDSTYA